MLSWISEYRRLEKEFQGGLWNVELERGAAALLDQKANHYTFDLYLKIKQALSGFDASELEFVNKIGENLSYNCCKRLQPESKIRLLALNLEYRNIDLEIFPDFKQPALSKALSRNLDRYPHLLQSLYQINLSNSAKAKQQNSFTNIFPKSALDAQSLLARTYPFDDLINIPEAPNIALVGNGPSSLGKGLGASIDSADFIIRFNNANIGGEYKHDYGSNSNLWVISPSTKIDPNQLLSNRICISGVSVFDKPSRYWLSLAKLADVNFYTFPKTVWYQLVAKLKAPPSAGLLTLATLCQKSDIKRNLTLYGMSIGETNSSKNHYGDNSLRSERHNWQLEAETVASLYRR